MSVRTILKKKSSIVFAFSLVIVLLSSCGFYASVGEIEGASGSNSQDFSIIIGEVKRIESRWEGEVIYSYVTIFVADVVSGHASLKNREVIINHLGGGVDNVVMWRSDQPTFAIGEKVKLHVRQVDQEHFAVVRGAEGKISLGNRFESLEAGAAAGYKLYWYHTTYGWATATTRPGSDWYGPLRWRDAWIPVGHWIDTTGTPSGITESAFITYVQRCYQTWEDDPGSYIDYSYLGTKTGVTWGANDGNNMFVWLLSDDTWVGVCNIWAAILNPNDYDSLRINDADVALNLRYSWSAAETCPSDKFDVQNVGTHEVGHATGLADLYDTGDSEQTMYGYVNYGETKKRALEGGDIAGVRVLYPTTFSYSAFVPHVHDDGTNWIGFLGLMNAGGTVSSVTFDFYDDNGVLRGSHSISLNSYSHYGRFLSQIYGGVFIGAVKIGSNQPFTGSYSQRNPTKTVMLGDMFVSSPPPQVSGCHSVFVPHVHDDGSNWVGFLGLANTGDTAATITFEFYDDYGNLKGSTAITLNPNAHYGRFINEIYGGSFVGAIKITSDQPFSGSYSQRNPSKTVMLGFFFQSYPPA